MTSPDNRSPELQPDEFDRRLRARYLEAVDRLDPVSAGRLRAARRAALQAATPPRARALQRALLPAGAFAVVAFAALVIWQPSTRQQAAPTSRAAVTMPAQDADSELPPDPDSTDPKLYQNLDFYDWLAANDRGKAMR